MLQGEITLQLDQPGYFKVQWGVLVSFGETLILGLHLTITTAQIGLQMMITAQNESGHPGTLCFSVANLFFIGMCH